jgi:hypothetical protein
MLQERRLKGAKKNRTESVSPHLMLWQARCIAVIEDEHAVSMVMLGPLRLKNHEIRFARIEPPVPVPA